MRRTLRSVQVFIHRPPTVPRATRHHQGLLRVATRFRRRQHQDLELFQELCQCLGRLRSVRYPLSQELAQSCRLLPVPAYMVTRTDALEVQIFQHGTWISDQRLVGSVKE